ncbi:hypothetical protein BBO99_00004015 [Phytophthora kernoviae]|uniref:WD40 repeat-containing protein SMU1 n=2 Tax=Phytophthora kernoviae TaxID=325452 RepID=A0A421F4T7_9STRA|nr:hypothetical protein G195_004585 [Phytophthora kernoviae 00238/432]KAG2511763.1 hypothetical protein JM16_008124 [Phytophthora kernoviae]KAG2528269.1 hypothetical protein JM18_003306 [Phytophthora kernoviae]RLN21495.1 hypothetical protein BBI17_004159 [Phytophthora kernoviae]RLN81052.1 hypothetical protein BBO99_00004015 [Phytophthora kernoviae]
MRLVHLLPKTTISRQDCSMLQNLADTLAGHNMAQYNTLAVAKNGRADPKRWREVRRQDDLRIYSERASSSKRCPSTPQLLLLGTVEGKLEDIMYGAVATTDEAMKIQSACTKDSVRDSKILYDIVRPSFDDPFRTVAVKWRLYEKRDYVSLDATGIVTLPGWEQIGYSLSHSVALADIPSFVETHGIERGNMSVCALYRQRTATTVECYVRGFFDFGTENDVLKNISLQEIASQWSAYARKSTCALAKKLSWKARKNCGWSSHSSRTYSFADDLDDFVAPKLRHRLPMSHKTRCAMCNKSSSFLSVIRQACTSCDLPICSKCAVKQSVVALAPDQHTVLERKRSFCMSCMTAVENCDVLTIAREELWSHVGHHRTSIPPEATFDHQDAQIKQDLLALITQYLQEEGFAMSSATIQDEANLLGKHLKKFHAAHQGFLYAVCKQEYLELIDRQEYQKAFTFLTTHLKPLEKVAAATSSSRHEFKDLCYLLTCKAVGESDAFRDWEGVVRSREKLVEQLRATFALEEVISPQQDGETAVAVPPVAMPDNRLVQLLHQSVAYQMEFSRYHPKTIPKVTTLLRDFECEVLPNAVKSTYVGHSQNVKFVTFVGTDGELLASGSSDASIKLWPTEIPTTQQEGGEEESDETSGTVCRYWTRDLLGHSSRIWYLSANASGERLYSGSGDGTVKIWDLRAALAERTAAELVQSDSDDLHNGQRGANVVQIAEAAATAPGTNAAIAAATALPHSYSVTSAECLATLMSPNGGDVYTVNLHPSETHLVTGGYDQSVRLWDIATGAVAKTFRGHFASVCDVQFNRHANFIVSGSKDGSIRLWDILSGLCVHTLRQTLGEVTSISMASNGYTLLSGSRNNSNRLWDLRMLHTPRTHLSTGLSSAGSSGGSSGSLSSYSGAGGSGFGNGYGSGYTSANGVGVSGGAGIGGSSGNLTAIGSFNSGSSTFSGSRNAEQRPLQRFKGHQNTAKNIVRASFGPRERFVLGGSEDGYVYVWEVATGKLLERLAGHRGVTYNARWHEKQALLASSSHDGTVKTWWWQEKSSYM